MPISFPVIIQTLMISGGPNKNIYFPKVFLMHNRALQREINQSIVMKTQQLIDKQMKDSPSTLEEMIGSFEIKNNQRDVLSFTFSNYAYHQQAAHGMTYINSLTYDLQKEKSVKLKDLFKLDSNYVNRISTLIQNQIQQREIPLLEDFTKIKPDQDFYIADRSLVIYFQLYELTPYVFGFPMFPISVYDIQDIIDEEGPLGRMAENN
ncbi:DUF3298 and DUF4163 domain-containing protein [Oceanobacillus halophilus]|uniref:DUF3298 domain-containing protein n=1 Tax=Oceanobacillus halophilus TaxID=930130 RepID=A0A495A0J2_9BACI|nr:DUF3298 and DUF4163 domain-containing protein [Oceanobacillus halophilus]RKQ32733.1 DUF3298 domain-containing protein [Oceanobacillus halophilus]